MADISAEQLDSINSWTGTWSAGGTWRRGQPSSVEWLTRFESDSVVEPAQIKANKTAIVSTFSGSSEPITAADRTSSIYLSHQLLSERITAVEITSNVVFTKASRSDSISMSDNEIAKAEFKASQRETGDVDESISGNSFASASAEERTTPVHGQSVVLGAVANIFSSTTFSDNYSGQFIARAGASSSVSAYEQLSIKVAFSAILRDSITAGTSESAKASMIASRTDAITADAHETGTGFYPATIPERLSAHDQISGGVFFKTQTSDTITAEDDVSGGNLISFEISENTVPGNVQSVLLHAVSQIKVQSTLADMSSVRNDAVSEIRQIVTAIDASNTFAYVNATENASVSAKESNESVTIIPVSGIEQTTPDNSQNVSVWGVAEILNHSDSTETSTVRNDAVASVKASQTAVDWSIGNYSTHQTVRELAVPETDEIGVYLSEQWLYDKLDPENNQSVFVDFASEINEITGSVENSTVILDLVALAVESSSLDASIKANYSSRPYIVEQTETSDFNSVTAVIFVGANEETKINSEQGTVVSTAVHFYTQTQAIDRPNGWNNAVSRTDEPTSASEMNVGNMTARVEIVSTAEMVDQETVRQCFSAIADVRANAENMQTVKGILTGHTLDVTGAVSGENAIGLMHIATDERAVPNDLIFGYQKAYASVTVEAVSNDMLMAGVDYPARIFEIDLIDDMSSCRMDWLAYQDDFTEAVSRESVNVGYLSWITEYKAIEETFTCKHFQFQIWSDHLSATDRFWVLKELDGSALWKVSKARSFNATGGIKPVWKINDRKHFKVDRQNDSAFKTRSNRTFKS